MRDWRSEEVIFHIVVTPLGKISIQAYKGIPVRIHLPGKGTEGAVFSSPPPAVREVMGALNGYFQGREPRRAVATRLLDYVELTPFAETVLREVIEIPRGQTRSYQDIAKAVGKPRAARAVGGVMRDNPYPILIPCHRVIREDGSPGGYGGSDSLKLWLLGFEGAPVKLY